MMKRFLLAVMLIATPSVPRDISSALPTDQVVSCRLPTGRVAPIGCIDGSDERAGTVGPFGTDKTRPASTKLEIVDDPAPLDYVNTRAAMIVQHADSADIPDNSIIPSVVLQMKWTGNGHVVPSSDFSSSINSGIFGYFTKSGDGSAQVFTASGELDATRGGGYNELGGFQYQLTNLGSAHATISGVEGIIADNGLPTRLSGTVSRINKTSLSNAPSNSFLASSEGTQPLDAIVGINRQGGSQIWRRGIDFRGAHFLTAPIVTTGFQVLPDGSLNLTEEPATAVATPGTGTQTLFIDSADHKLKRKDSTGAITVIG
jgi:hypothetical protein